MREKIKSKSSIKYFENKYNIFLKEFYNKKYTFSLI